MPYRMSRTNCTQLMYHTLLYLSKSNFIHPGNFLLFLCYHSSFILLLVYHFYRLLRTVHYLFGIIDRDSITNVYDTFEKGDLIECIVRVLLTLNRSRFDLGSSAESEHLK
jgi:hypothetical protein